MNVEIVWAAPRQSRRETVELAADCTVADALNACSFLADLQLGPLETLALGVYGERRALGDRLQEGDRVEIYRPLQTDPMAQRRARARG